MTVIKIKTECEQMLQLGEGLDHTGPLVVAIGLELGGDRSYATPWGRE